MSATRKITNYLLTLALIMFPCAVRAANSDPVKAEIVHSDPLRKGTETPVIIHLTHADGMPVITEELDIVHTQPLHILTADPQFQDYQHVHSHPLQNKFGNYAFFLTPHTDCGYRTWIDMTIHGQQQFAMIDLPGVQSCMDKPADKTVITESSLSGGYHFVWKGGPMKAGTAAMITIDATGPDGQPFEQLEPVMGAFIHLVGFYDDYKTIVHAHAQGEEPNSLYDYGGPSLQFHIMPEKAGFIHFFAQCRIAGKEYFVPFGIKVEK